MIELRDLGPEDCERMFRWRREPDVDRWMYGLPPEDIDLHRRWFEAFLADGDRKGWIIVRMGEPVGFLSLQGLTLKHRRAQLGWFIGEPAARGRGVGRAAQALGLERGFSDFDLGKIWSEVLADNDAALRAQAAAGFRREGYLRRHALKAGAFHDVVVLGILEEEWRERRASVLKDLAVSHLIAA